ncbi:MAG TPA: hypothetical protein VKI44_20780 [Acetobacteraceae bacterium]|nr:hypothetical protein [Acetobacteraceae bacterium]
MDAQPTDLAQRARGLEETLTALDLHLTEVEKQVASLLKAVRRLRRSAREGAIASLPTAIAAAKADADRAGEPLTQAAATLDYDIADAFASGAWLDELAAAAKDAGVVLVRRDGRVTAYPVALRLDARAQGVRIGRKLEKRIRPSFVAAQLKALQQRPERFNARQFLDRLFVLYDSKARAEDPAWRPGQPGQGPLVSLADLHDLLTLLPAAGADYPQEEFVADLLRLDRQPDATDSHGRRFELGGSTGRKGGKRLTLFDETGEQHDYYAIRFILEPSDGCADNTTAAAR